MPIDVEIQDELGGTIARYNGPSLGLDFVKIAPADSVCFRFIDPWDDTTFNQAQVEVLLSELCVVAQEIDDSARQFELKALIQFLEQANEMHTYVKFIGD